MVWFDYLPVSLSSQPRERELAGFHRHESCLPDDNILRPDYYGGIDLPQLNTIRNNARLALLAGGNAEGQRQIIASLDSDPIVAKTPADLGKLKTEPADNGRSLNWEFALTTQAGHAVKIVFNDAWGLGWRLGRKYGQALDCRALGRIQENDSSTEGDRQSGAYYANPRDLAMATESHLRANFSEHYPSRPFQTHITAADKEEKYIQTIAERLNSFLARFFNLGDEDSFLSTEFKQLTDREHGGRRAELVVTRNDRLRIHFIIEPNGQKRVLFSVKKQTDWVCPDHTEETQRLTYVEEEDSSLAQEASALTDIIKKFWGGPIMSKPSKTHHCF